jgi:hypothetical protein
MGQVQTLGSVTATRIEELKRNKKTTSRSDTSIELPDGVVRLITGSDYWINAKTNRYKKLIREGYLKDLLEIAEMAKDRDNPAHWFARTCSKVMWDRTLKFLEKRRRLSREASLAAERCDIPKYLILKKAWQGANVMLAAVTASEVGRDQISLFQYLTGG